jgi:hypothetical protein
MTPPPAAGPRPIVRPTAPERYRVQFTIGEATHEKLRRLQTLLRTEIPGGDPGVIFDRAISLLLEHVEKKKLGATARPRSRAPIRRETDNEDIRTPPPSSRDIPRAVKRAVWKRDGGRCAFVSVDGRRCTEREFVQFHHVQAYAKRGPATVENICCAAGATTNTKRNLSSDLTAPRSSVRPRASRTGPPFRAGRTAPSGEDDDHGHFFRTRILRSER